MLLDTELKSKAVQRTIRQIGIDPNFWYAVGWSHQLKENHVMPVTIWQQRIAVYRDAQDQLHAIADACAHRGVSLHKGEVWGCNLVCPYHGWEFSGDGQCVKIPYFSEAQKLPPMRIQNYPVQEEYGLIWIFPENLAESRSLPEISEYNNSEFLMVPVMANFKAHFSICNENTMDVFHGYLHRSLQGWFNPVLVQLSETEDTICARYQVSYQGRFTKFLNLSQTANQVTTRTVSVQYQYPHYFNALEGVSSLYLMRLPISPTESRSFTLLFVKIRLPKWLLQLTKPILIRLIRQFLFLRFLKQDIEIIEDEQQTYLKNSEQQYVEINPAIFAAQRLMIRQYRNFDREGEKSNSEESSAC